MAVLFEHLGFFEWIRILLLNGPQSLLLLLVLLSAFTIGSDTAAFRTRRRLYAMGRGLSLQFSMEGKVRHFTDVIEVRLINRLFIQSNVNLTVSARALLVKRHWVRSVTVP